MSVDPTPKESIVMRCLLYSSNTYRRGSGKKNVSQIVM
jgi:hypothetical protein